MHGVELLDFIRFYCTCMFVLDLLGKFWMNEYARSLVQIYHISCNNQVVSSEWRNCNLTIARVPGVWDPNYNIAIVPCSCKMCSGINSLVLYGFLLWYIWKKMTSKWIHTPCHSSWTGVLPLTHACIPKLC